MTSEESQKRAQINASIAQIDTQIASLFTIKGTVETAHTNCSNEADDARLIYNRFIDDEDIKNVITTGTFEGELATSLMSKVSKECGHFGVVVTRSDTLTSSLLDQINKIEFKIAKLKRERAQLEALL